MTTNISADSAKQVVLFLDVDPDRAPTPRSLAYAVSRSAKQRVLSVPSVTQNKQHDRKAARSSMNSESVPTDPFAVAQSACATWSRIDDALSPIIGRRGVAGLYKRSLSLTRGAHPVLTMVFDGVIVPGDYSTLHQALAQQSATVAIASSDALLQTFTDLLSKLIGPLLTERLLRPMLNNPLSSGDAVQDTSP